MRKIIQLATESPCAGVHDGILYALCDDGSAWYLDKGGWEILPLIPQNDPYAPEVSRG